MSAFITRGLGNIGEDFICRGLGSSLFAFFTCRYYFVRKATNMLFTRKMTIKEFIRGS